MATRLQVGEVEYFVDAEQITKYNPGSYFAKLFTSDPEDLGDGQIGYFINRDGGLFKYILSGLRNSDYQFPLNWSLLLNLHNEALFYNLENLRQKLVKLRTNIGITNVPSGIAFNFSDILLQVTMLVVTEGYRTKFTFPFNTIKHTLYQNSESNDKDSYFNGNVAYLATRGYYLTRVDKINEAPVEKTLYTFQLKQDPVY